MTPRFIRFWFQQIAIISIVIVYNPDNLLVIGGYPFSSDDLSVRQLQILDKLRGDMTLLINEEIVPNELREPYFGAQFLRNVEGQLFSASVYQKPKTVPPVIRNRPELTDPSLLSGMLKGHCSVLPDVYWNVEWCHREEVRQFHSDILAGRPERSPDYSLGKYDRTAVVRERGDYNNQSARIVKLVDYYTDGQHCDETDGTRSSDVHIQCCNGLHVNAVNKDTVTSVAQKNQPHARLNGAPNPPNINEIPVAPLAALKAISEPSVCRYQLVVCSPLLCDDKSEEQLEEEREAHREHPGMGREQHRRFKSLPKNNTLSQVMVALSLECVYRTEEWWVYELCFNRGIRQFRMEEVAMAPGQVLVKDAPREEVLVSEFSLGVAPTTLYLDNDALEDTYYRTAGIKRSKKENEVEKGGEEGTKKEKEKDDGSEDGSNTPAVPGDGRVSVADMGLGLPSPALLARDYRTVRAIQLEFSSGTPCDIEHTNRSSTVQVFCGVRDMITEVVEDRTCHYNIKVVSVLACSSPLLAPKAKKVLTVEFTAVAPGP